LKKFEKIAENKYRGLSGKKTKYIAILHHLDKYLPLQGSTVQSGKRDIY
jgi:hypothetical protein